MIGRHTAVHTRRRKKKHRHRETSKCCFVVCSRASEPINISAAVYTKTHDDDAGVKEKANIVRAAARFECKACRNGVDDEENRIVCGRSCSVHSYRQNYGRCIHTHQ